MVFPQGSVLGPLLFFFAFLLMTLLTSSHHPKKCGLNSLADDMKSYIRVTNADAVTNFSLPPWLHLWLVQVLGRYLYLSKNVTGWFSNRDTSQLGPFALNDSPLVKIDETKDLGIIFNSKLSFSSHLSTIVAKAKSRSFLLFKSFHKLWFKEHWSLPSPRMSFPILDYCSSCLVASFFRRY